MDETQGPLIFYICPDDGYGIMQTAFSEKIVQDRAESRMNSTFYFFADLTTEDV